MSGRRSFGRITGTTPILLPGIIAMLGGKIFIAAHKVRVEENK